MVEHAGDGLRFYNLQPGAVATERVLAAGEKLAFVAKHAAPVDLIGRIIGRIVTSGPEEFSNGSTIEVQDLARAWGILPERAPTGSQQ